VSAEELVGLVHGEAAVGGEDPFGLFDDEPGSEGGFELFGGPPGLFGLKTPTRSCASSEQRPANRTMACRPYDGHWADGLSPMGRCRDHRGTPR
jgi:hypothetical protein